MGKKDMQRKAQELLRDAKRKFEQRKQIDRAMNDVLIAGDIFLKECCDAPSALQCYSVMLQCAAALHDATNIAHAHRWLGEARREMDDLQEACEEALKYLDAAGRVPSADVRRSEVQRAHHVVGMYHKEYAATLIEQCDRLRDRLMEDTCQDSEVAQLRQKIDQLDKQRKVVYDKQRFSNSTQAVSHCTSAWELAQSCMQGESVDETKRRRAYALLNLTHIYRMAGEHKHVLDKGHRTRKLAVELKDDDLWQKAAYSLIEYYNEVDPSETAALDLSKELASRARKRYERQKHAYKNECADMLLQCSYAMINAGAYKDARLVIRRVEKIGAEYQTKLHRVEAAVVRLRKLQKISGRAQSSNQSDILEAIADVLSDADLAGCNVGFYISAARCYEEAAANLRQSQCRSQRQYACKRHALLQSMLLCYRDANRPALALQVGQRLLQLQTDNEWWCEFLSAEPCENLRLSYALEHSLAFWLPKQG